MLVESEELVLGVFVWSIAFCGYRFVVLVVFVVKWLECYIVI